MTFLTKKELKENVNQKNAIIFLCVVGEEITLDSSVGRAFDCSVYRYRIVAGSIPAPEIYFLFLVTKLEDLRNNLRNFYTPNE